MDLPDTHESIDPTAAPATPPDVCGTVQWFDAQRGYGWVATATAGSVFVHRSGLTPETPTLLAGQEVCGQLHPAARGPELRAVSVCVDIPRRAGTVLWFDAARGIGAAALGVLQVPIRACDLIGGATVQAGDPVRCAVVPGPRFPVGAAVELAADAALIPTVDATTAHLAAALGETAAEPIGQLRRLVWHLGAAAALTLLDETQAIEAAGGQWLPDQQRRRTPGGVFFALARAQLPPEARAAVFYRETLRRTPRPARPAPKPAPMAPPVEVLPPPPHAQAALSAPPAPPFAWTERGPLIAEARLEQGVVQTVKVTLIGRPAKVVERQDFTLLLLNHAGPLPALPKGIPVPATFPKTTYIVYVAGKQWRGVKEALTNPDDVLIVEGAQCYDPEYAAIAVFATNTTTKMLQQAKRQRAG